MEPGSLLKAVMGLALVIGLLLLCAAAVRVWGAKLGLAASMPINKNNLRKIQLLETAMLDVRHRLVRVRIGAREHAILLGGAQPVVVESKNTDEGA